MLQLAPSLAPFRIMQVRITDKPLQTMIERSAKEANRSIPKQVEHLVRTALISINKKL
jgi:hypothetical protein